MKIKNIYERYHNVIIDNDMINYIINLSEKYILIGIDQTKRSIF